MRVDLAVHPFPINLQQKHSFCNTPLENNPFRKNVTTRGKVVSIEIYTPSGPSGDKRNNNQAAFRSFPMSIRPWKKQARVTLALRRQKHAGAEAATIHLNQGPGTQQASSHSRIHTTPIVVMSHGSILGCPSKGEKIKRRPRQNSSRGTTQKRNHDATSFGRQQPLDRIAKMAGRKRQRRNNRKQTRREEKKHSINN